MHDVSFVCLNVLPLNLYYKFLYNELFMQFVFILIFNADSLNRKDNHYEFAGTC